MNFFYVKIYLLAVCLLLTNLPVLAGEIIRLPEKPRLFVLSIGINKYQSGQYNLRFARSDAETMNQNLMNRGSKKIYSEIKTARRLLDEQATRANILTALDELAGEMASTDSLIVFFAGIGGTFDKTTQHRGTVVELSSDRKLQFYLFPYDANTDNVEETGISSELLQVYLQRIRAKNKLFVFDSCHSAFGYDSIAETFTRVKRSRDSPFAAKLIEALQENGRKFKVLLGYEIVPFFGDLGDQNVEKGKLDDLSDGDFVFVAPLKK